MCFSGVPLSSGYILCSEDVVECVFMVQFKLHFLSGSCLLLAEEKAQQWLTLQCCNILKTTQSPSHDSFYYVIHICTFSWHWIKKKRNAKSSIEEIIYVITAFSIAKMAVFKITVFPRTSNFFSPTNSPVTLLKKSFKCHLKTVYADCICFW